MKQLLLVILIFPVFGYSQKLPEFGFNKVHITSGDQNIQAEILPLSSDPRLYNDRFYFWYSSNQIHATQGGYSGRLLSGKYKSFYPNKELKEEGFFKEGLKEGIWKMWNEQGKLAQQYTWKKGILSGNFIICDDQGFIKQSGKYKNGIIKVADSTSIWRKIMVFKKRSAFLVPGNK